MDADHARHLIHGRKPPLTYRLSNFLERRGWLPPVRAWIAHLAMGRTAKDWEWIMSQAEGRGVQIDFITYRIPTLITVIMSAVPEERTATLSSWTGTEWVDEAVQVSWESRKDEVILHVRPNRLILAKRLKLDLHGTNKFRFRVIPSVARHVYQDVVYIQTGNELAKQERVHEAVAEYEKCIRLEPNHYIASLQLARISVDEKRWTDAVRWAVHANVHSRGEYCEQMIWDILKNQRGPLEETVTALRDEAESWDVGGHYGSICLLNDTSYWFGFGRFHLMQRRQIIDVRRQAAARLLRHLYFDFVDGKELVVFAGLRVWRNGAPAIDVPLDHLAVIDHADDNPSIRTEGRRRALFHCPELKRGDALELVYGLIRGYPERTEGKPDFFVLADLSTQFPTWTSRTAIHTPPDWDIRCVTTNGAPPAEEVDVMSDFRTRRVEMSRIVYDEWGISETERLYRCPHLCCSWGDRDWSDIAVEGSSHFCHKLREDSVPAPIQQVVDAQATVENKLRAGYEWIRDNLKYMSLKANKVRTNDPDLAAKIVNDGVGDCMDRAYLVALLCRQLGLEHEYVVTASESEYVVPDIPSQQFDHILVRTHLNGAPLYLDATSSETPFRWTPRYLQGLHVLPLTHDATLETVPEEPSDRNHVAIIERLMCSADGTLTGAFEMSASGMPGRWWDSHWKATTMDVMNPLRVARLALHRQMPTAELQEWDITPYDIEREQFSLRGGHTRRELFAVDGRLFGLIDWRTELFQIHEYKDRVWRGTSILPLPLHYTIALSITAPDGFVIEGTSDLMPFSSDFGDVTTTVSCAQSELTLQSLLRVKRKFVHVERDDDMLAFLEAWKRALTFAFVLRAGG